MEEFKKCNEHKAYQEGITQAEFIEDLASDKMLFDWDNACDISPLDYGYELCEECYKYIQIE